MLGEETGADTVESQAQTAPATPTNSLRLRVLLLPPADAQTPEHTTPPE